MQPLSIQGFSLYKETLLNLLRKEEGKKALGSLSPLQAEASLPRIKAE